MRAAVLPRPAMYKAIKMGADEARSAPDVGRISGWAQNRGTVDVVVEVSVTARGLETAMKAAIADGTAVQVGDVPAGLSQLLVTFVMSQNLRHLGTSRFGLDYRTALAKSPCDHINPQPPMTHHFTPADANEVVAMAVDRSQSIKVYLDFSA